MEFLPTTLAQCIDRYGILPEEINYSILREVALGLRYLHEQQQPIIHRDLSANNVLLTPDMKAKISDLGVAKILRLSPSQMSRMTRGPGTISYMPPEALVPNPHYDVKVDIFSYGVMMVHAFSGRWPLPSEAVRVNPNNPADLTPVSEADRREEYLNDIGRDHPLMDLILHCLRNSPTHRPQASEVLQRVSEGAAQFPPSFNNKVDMLEQVKADSSEKNALREEKQTAAQTWEAVERQQPASSIEVERLRLQMADLRTDMDQLREENEELSQSYQTQIQSEQNLHRARTESERSAYQINIQVMEAQIQSKKDRITARNATITRKIQALSDQLVQPERCLTSYIQVELSYTPLTYR